MQQATNNQLKQGLQVYHEPSQAWGSIHQVTEEGYYLLHIAPFKIVKAYKHELQTQEPPKEFRAFNCRQGWTKEGKQQVIIWDNQNKEEISISWDQDITGNAWPDQLLDQVTNFFNSIHITITGFSFPSNKGDLLVMTDNLNKGPIIKGGDSIIGGDLI